MAILKCSTVYWKCEQVHWDFVQIQLNYVDWRHASAYNADWQKAMGDDTNADYLYGELAKARHSCGRHGAVIGRKGCVTQDVLVQMKQMRPEESAAAWGFPALPGHSRRC